MKTKFKYKSKEISLEVKKCSFLERILGLMFTRKNKAQALLFDFGKPTTNNIHSLFVFFDFVGVWLDGEDNVINVQLVKQWRFSVLPRGKEYSKLIEIPVNERYSEVIHSLI